MLKRNLDYAPMGWNSWDCYGASVTESEVRANAEFMAQNLLKYGWEYIVVDIQWFEPAAKSNEYNDGARLVTDGFSRLMPAVNRFPSAADGCGFAPLAEYIHSLGLKFGIHILRGIPRQAVAENTQIMGTAFRAADIADTGSICSWNTDMFGVDMSKDGAQEYYNSLFRLYAGWGVDFVKVDDIARPYHKGEVEAIRRAIDSCGRDIILSLSPGEAPLCENAHLAGNADMWRISDDFWDEWRMLLKMFDYCRDWARIRTVGYPDCDMLPLGRIGIRSLGGARETNFTPDEQKTMLTLWCIFNSPLMFGGDLTMSSAGTISMLQNENLLKMHKSARNAKEVSRADGVSVWHADGYKAAFNLSDEVKTIGISEKNCRELWSGSKVSSDSITLPPHGSFAIILEK